MKRKNPTNKDHFQAINGLHMMMNQQMHQITMVSEVVSDLLDFLDKKEEFKVYLQEKQALREDTAKKKKEKKDDNIERDNRK